MTRSGGDGETAAEVVPIHHFDLAHDLRPEPADARAAHTGVFETDGE